LYVLQPLVISGDDQLSRESEQIVRESAHL
jgi:hypothetical protein